MKCELTKDNMIVISAETIAEAYTIRYLFKPVLRPPCSCNGELGKKIMFDSSFPEEKSK